jgi:hypothetical protein
VMKQVFSSGERLMKYDIPAIVKGMLPLLLRQTHALVLQ